MWCECRKAYSEHPEEEIALSGAGTSKNEAAWVSVTAIRCRFDRLRGVQPSGALERENAFEDRLPCWGVEIVEEETFY